MRWALLVLGGVACGGDVEGEWAGSTTLELLTGPVDHSLRVQLERGQRSGRAMWVGFATLETPEESWELSVLGQDRGRRVEVELVPLPISVPAGPSGQQIEVRPDFTLQLDGRVRRDRFPASLVLAETDRFFEADMELTRAEAD